jgi:hypothetical protein
MFRQPSLAQEAEAALAGPHNLSILSRPDSLANSALGTTFAAKARAAELQAARTRKKLKENENTAGESFSSAAYEPLTFTKARARGGRTWKPLNLDDGTKEQDEESHDSFYHLPMEFTTLGDVQLTASTGSYEYAEGQNTASALSNATHSRRGSYQQQLPALTSRGPSHTQSGLMKDPQNLLAGEIDDATQDKGTLPRRETTGTTVSVPTPSTHETARAPLYTPYPLPVLTSSFEEVQKNAEYLTRKQATLLEYLGNATKSASPERLPHDEGSVFEDYDHAHASCYDGRRASEPEVPNRLFSASPTAESSVSQQQPSDYKYNHSEVAYNPPARHPRPIMPHQYPAVKGTMPGNQRSSFERRASQEPFTQQLHDCSPIGQNTPKFSSINLNSAPETRYRKLSSTETKGMMLQHLSGVVDHASGGSPTSVGPSNHGRTVLHDPFARMKDQNTGFTPPEPLSDIISASDPLPWKSRRVDIVRPTQHPEGATVDSTYPETTTFSIPAYRRGANGTQISREAELAELERWWSAPLRARELRKKEKKETMSHPPGLGFNIGSVGDYYDHGHGYDSMDPLSDTTVIGPDAQVGDVADDLLFPVLKNLTCYLMPGGGFNKYSRVMDWCIDQSANGQKSFFGEDWGQLPPRVGRDPRYKPVPHDGTRSVYEPLTGRWGTETYPRRYPIR